MYSSLSASMTSTPLAASTSSALTLAGRYRQRVRVNAEEQRAANFPLDAIIANSLTDRQNMSLIKGIFKRGTTVA